MYPFINITCNEYNNSLPCTCKDSCEKSLLSTNLITYQGPPLACLTVENCDNLTTIFQKINNLLCETFVIPTLTSQLINDGSNGNFTYLESNQVSLVTFTGSYNDLNDIPIITSPDLQSVVDVNGEAYIINNNANIEKTLSLKFLENIDNPFFEVFSRTQNFNIGTDKSSFIRTIDGIIELYQSNNNKSTSILFEEPIANTVVKFPTKTIPGIYTLATTDDIVLVPLEYNNTEKTVWNNGKGDIETNTTFGFESLINNTGDVNTAFGYRTLKNNSSGIRNSAFGTNSLLANTTGGYNTAFGQFTLFSNTIGGDNTAVGAGALAWLNSGSYNTVIGRNAGSGPDTSITTLNNGVYVGAFAIPFGSNQTNEIVIGYLSSGLGSNSSVIGNSSTLRSRIWGRFLSGTSIDDGINQGQFSGTVSASPATLSNQVVVKSQLDAVKPYKVYTALLTRTGAVAPNAIVLENTLGTITFGYTLQGVYTVISSNLFTLNKTVVFIQNQPVGAFGVTLGASRITSSDIQIIQSTSAGTSDNDWGFPVSIEIKVYN